MQTGLAAALGGLLSEDRRREFSFEKQQSEVEQHVGDDRSRYEFPALEVSQVAVNQSECLVHGSFGSFGHVRSLSVHEYSDWGLDRAR